MPKRTIILLLGATIVVVVALGIGAYFTFFRGFAPESDDTPHFSVIGVSSPAYFAGETVIVEANVINDEPEREVAVPTTTMVTVTADPNNSSSRASVTAVPTEIIRMIGIDGSNLVSAEMKGPGGINVVRTMYLPVNNGETRTIQFDFGQVPAGSYVVTVTAFSYINSSKSYAVNVYRAPTLDDWTVTGEAAFMMVNIRHDNVDVDIRNNGPRTVIFGNGSGQYLIYVNSSDDFGVPLLGLDETVVRQGQEVSVNATIPAAGRYYLDHFAICVPGKPSLVRIPVKTWIDA
jgi:hypothetical protein